MKLSVVVINWNDLGVLKDCLKSIYDETKDTEFEVVISDNGSEDDSVKWVQENYPQARIVENGENLGFGKGNNRGIEAARGDYVLILNPDTVILDRALDKWVAWADQHSDAGAFGCRVLNPDMSDQQPARPIPTVFGYFLAALCIRFPGRFLKSWETDVYPGWDGTSEREVGYQSGCCVMFRGDVLRELDGFDERFFYHYEETDLCYRCWKMGRPIRFFPGAEIIHLGGQSVGRFPIRFELEKYRNRYRFFYKHYGEKGVRRMRKISLLSLYLRYAGYRTLRLLKSSEALDNRLAKDRACIQWNRNLDPMKFVTTGDEIDLGYEPLAPAPDMTVEPLQHLRGEPS